MKKSQLLVIVFTLFLGGFASLYLYISTHAAPPATPYEPGETLSPSCSPGDTNCTVIPPATSGANMNITETTALTLMQVSGTDSLTVENIGTAHSLVVEDEASDGTPFVVDASGNVGVKNASPSSALDVAGDVEISGTTQLNGVSYTWPGSNGSGQLTNDGSGNLSWASSSGGGGVRAPIVFTRSITNSNNSNVTKDSLCSAQFGDQYVAATLPESMFYIGALSVASTAWFTVANSNDAWYYQRIGSDDYLSTANASQQNTHLLCISKSAPIRTTRSSINSNSTNTTKDSTCATLGTGYKTATLKDLLFHVGNAYNSTFLVFLNETNSYSLIPVSGSRFFTFQNNSQQVGPVVCLYQG